MQGFTTIQTYSQDAAAKLDKEFAALGPRIVLERVSVPYQIFFDAVPAEHLAFFSSLSPFWRTPEDHDGWPHPRIVGRTYGLDTIGEGVLTALRLPDAAIFQSRRFL